MKTGIILAGGTLTAEFAGKIIEEYSSRGGIILAAADAGLEVLDALGKQPDLLLGDFDTVDPGVLSRYEGQDGVVTERHDPVKDASDLELCVDALRAMGVEKTVVLGALGGRADHTLANIRLTYYARRIGMDLILLDPQNRIRCLIGGEETFECRIARGEQWGKYIGLFPIGGPVAPLDLEGFRYPLHGFQLDDRTSPSFSISNEITAECGVIRFRSVSGSGLIIVESKDRQR